MSLINSIDTANDSGFASYVLSNDAAVAALQTELDGTQAGAGLGSNGSYSANTGVSYIGSAASLHDADKKLDVQLKVVADGLAQELLDRASEIALEKLHASLLITLLMLVLISLKQILQLRLMLTLKTLQNLLKPRHMLMQVF